MPRCPVHPEVELEAKKRGWYCEECGGNVLGYDRHPRLGETAPAGRSLDSLPALLAIPLDGFATEPSPVLRLWHACDAVELTLRLVVVLGVAELSAAGPLPDDLRRKLRDSIEEPTLGRWKQMALEVVRRLPADDPFCPVLGDLAERVLAPLLDGPRGPRRPETSLSALRNQLAHGGGVTRAVAARLLAVWEPHLGQLVAALAPLSEVALVVRTAPGVLGILAGPSPAPRPWAPVEEGLARRVEPLLARGDEVVAVRGARCLPLWPLGAFGRPRPADPDAPPAREATPLVYVRRGDVHLQLTAVGSEEAAISHGDDDALAHFLELFRVEALPPDAAAQPHAVPGFEAELRKEGARLVGRIAELEAARRALAETPSGLLWLAGAAGAGKSCLVARLATELLDEPPPGTLVLPFRFRAGDPRCSRESFLRFALERLPEPEGGETDERKERQDASAKALLRALGERLEKLGTERALFLLDGLDEIEGRDRGFARDVVVGLAGKGGAWLCAGRPEGGLPEAFAGARAVFPDGLPPMGEGDVRTMLLERIGSRRQQLLRSDRDQGDRVVNPFVTRVVEAARGLPLYVALLINDILGNRFRALDAGEKLPPSLEAYFEELLRACGIGVVEGIKPHLVATLAVAREPIAPAVLADLLARGGVLAADEEALGVVHRALAAVGSMVKRVTAADGSEAFELYHHALRQRLEASPDARGLLALARQRLCTLALETVAPARPAARYLHRWGVVHLLEAGRPAEALCLLTSFARLMARLQALGDPEGPLSLEADWQAIVASGAALDRDARIWEAFCRERAHILRRGDEHWPSYKILLQLAVEHADDSPATVQAERWLEEGRCDWLWIRNPQRAATAPPRSCLRVFEGHGSRINGAIVVADGRILSWSRDGTLRLWTAEGMPLAKLDAHGKSVIGATVLPDGRFLSWSRDPNLRLWAAEGFVLASLKGHADWVNGATVQADGRILSWSRDGTLRLWTTEGGPLARLAGHAASVNGAAALADDRLLSWSTDHTLRLWTTEGSPLARMEGHAASVNGAAALADGRLLSWSMDHTLRLWTAEGAPLARLEGHAAPVSGATVHADRRVLSWSRDGTLRLWTAEGAPLAKLEGHGKPVDGAAALLDGRILSWSRDRTLRLWTAEGVPLARFTGHADRVNGATALGDGRILSWSSDSTLRLWTAEGDPLAKLEGHTDSVSGATVLADGRILSWSGDRTMRLWTEENTQPASPDGHRKTARGAIALADGRILSWSDDTTLRLWAAEGRPLSTLAGHRAAVNGATVLADGRFLSWSDDHTLRLWTATGARLARLAGHTGWIFGVTVLVDGRILSWSRDCTLRLWTEKGTPLASLKGHQKSVIGATVLSGGRILSWSGDHTLRLWTTEGAPLAKLEGHGKSVDGAAALPDGRILSWSRDRTLRLWTAEGAPLARLEGHADWVTGATVLKDGSILSWARDRTLRLWSAAGSALGRYGARAGADVLWAEFCCRSGTVEPLLRSIDLSPSGERVRVAEAEWQSNATPRTKALLPDGRVIVTFASGFVFSLGLVRGNCRVSLAEAAELARAPGTNRGPRPADQPPD